MPEDHPLAAEANSKIAQNEAKAAASSSIRDEMDAEPSKGKREAPTSPDNMSEDDSGKGQSRTTTRRKKKPKADV